MSLYPIQIEEDDNGTLLITCPALPEVTTFAEDELEVSQRARGAIEEAIAARIADGREVPAPSSGLAARLAKEQLKDKSLSI